MATLRRALGEASGADLHELSWGRDPRRVVPEQAEKSIGAEETFARDVDDPDVVLRELLRLSERVAARLRVRRDGRPHRGAQGPVRRLHHDHPVPHPAPSTPTWPVSIYATARELYDALGLERARLRLVGVRLEGLVDAGDSHHQLALDERPQGWREAEQAVDRASARFGAGVGPPGQPGRPGDLTGRDRSPALDG